MNEYGAGLVISLFCGLISVFFSQGGFKKPRMFWKLTRKPGKWHRPRIVILLGMACIGLYGIWIFQLSRDFVGFILICSYLTAMTFTDLRKREIPDDATVFFAAVYLIFRISSLNPFYVLNGLIGAVVGGIFPFVVYLINKDSIGLGDVKLIACLGIATGFPEIIYLMARGLVLAMIYSIIMLIIKKVTVKTELPLVPFLLIGTLL